MPACPVSEVLVIPISFRPGWVRSAEWLQFSGVVAQPAAFLCWLANDSVTTGAWIAAGGLTALLVGAYADRSLKRWSQRILVAAIYIAFMGIPVGFLTEAWLGWFTGSVGGGIALFALLFVMNP